MPKLSAAEFKQLLMRDLPQALAPARPSRAVSGNGRAEVANSAKPAKKGASESADMLATEDAVVVAEFIPDVARYLRDTLGYEFLSNITAVDYLADGLIELVYHFGDFAGSLLTVKTRVPRDKPSAPSITPFWPGASLQEREAFDLYGVDFSGHPELRRIYMWEEFEGFPMRKDFPKQGDKYFDEDE